MFSAATLRQRTSLLNSFAVILRVVGRRAALQDHTAGSKVGLPSGFLRPKLKIARAFNVQFLATYRSSAKVVPRGEAVAAAALSSSGGPGVSRELAETESSALRLVVEVRDFSYFLP